MVKINSVGYINMSVCMNNFISETIRGTTSMVNFMITFFTVTQSYVIKIANAPTLNLIRSMGKKENRNTLLQLTILCVSHYNVSFCYAA